MRVTIPIDSLKTAVELAQKATGGSSYQPILNAIFVRASGDVLELGATDLESFVSVDVAGAMVEAPGDGLIDPSLVLLALKAQAELLKAQESRAKRAGKTLSGAAGATVELFSDGEKLRLKVGSTRPVVSPDGVSDPAEFPITPELGPQQSIQIETAVLAYALALTSSCRSTDGGRPNLTGTDIRLNAGECTIAATDGHRLGLVTAKPGTVSGDDGTGGIIPLNAGDLLSEVITGATCTLHFGKGLVAYHAPALGNRGAVTLTMRLIDAQFPDFRRVMPKLDLAKTITVQAEDIFAALEGIGKAEKAIAKKKDKKALLILETEADLPVLRVYGSVLGDDGLQALVDASVRDAGPFKAGTNPDYFLNLSAAAFEPIYTTQLIGANDPIVFRPATSTPGVEIVTMVMPMRL